MNRFSAVPVGMVAALALALLAPSSFAQDGSAVGMVIETVGTVEIERGGARSTAQLADLLFTGDRVLAAAGEVAFVFCPTERRIGLATGSVVELTPTDVTRITGPEPAVSPTICVLPQVALGAESMERVGGLRGRGYPAIPLYLGGQISRPRPLFEWGEVEGVDSYRLSVTGEDGLPVWEETVRSTSIRYPESMPQLEEKSYRWEVLAERDGEMAGQQAANFTVKPDPSLREVEDDDQGSLLIRAAQFENAGYYAEAAALYARVRGEESDARIGRRLAWLYWNAGLIAAANEELDRLQ